MIKDIINIFIKYINYIMDNSLTNIINLVANISFKSIINKLLNKKYIIN